MTAADLALAEEAFRQGDYDGTLRCLNRLAGLSGDPRAMNLLATTFAKLGMTADAAEMFEQAAERDDEWAGVFLRKAARLFLEAGDRQRAELNALRLVRLIPEDPDAAFVLISLARTPKDRRLVENLKYNLVASEERDVLELAQSLLGESRGDERLFPLYRKLSALKPGDGHLRGVLMAFAREYADYELLDTLEAQAAAANPPPLVEGALDRLLWEGDERKTATAVYPLSVAFDPAARERRRRAPHAWGRRLRIGYVSGDFRPDHVVMRQLADVLRQHDRSRFEITLFSNTEYQGKDAKRYFAALGQKVDIGGLTDEKAAREIRKRNIDILVDLSGYTAGSRSALMNMGLAPIQVNWLGYPAGAEGIDCDYIIGDAVVTPDMSSPFFGEKFCRLPESYMPNDPTVRPLPTGCSRADQGLPDEGFVFASFNAPKKITPRVISVWACILSRVPGSLLWMACRTRLAEENMRLRFQKLGIDPARIHFAEPVRSHNEHIARLRAADLGLDPFPYNGHATTADCLWAGLPVLALKGTNFASRVSQSQLRALGIAGLVAETQQDYIEKAVCLALDPGKAHALKAQIDSLRLIAPLFDSQRFCRHLERGFELMAERARSGALPDHIDVPALPPREGPFMQTGAGGA